MGYNWTQKDITNMVYGVSINEGTPKRLVYRENPIEMDDLGVAPMIETPISNKLPQLTSINYATQQVSIRKESGERGQVVKTQDSLYVCVCVCVCVCMCWCVCVYVCVYVCMYVSK